MAIIIEEPLFLTESNMSGAPSYPNQTNNNKNKMSNKHNGNTGGWVYHLLLTYIYIECVRNIVYLTS